MEISRLGEVKEASSQPLPADGHTISRTFAHIPAMNRAEPIIKRTMRTNSTPNGEENTVSYIHECQRACKNVEK